MVKAINKNKNIKLAVLLTHPIQYQSPLLTRIASEPDIDLEVFYQSDCSSRRHLDEGFSTEIDWDVPLLEGYSYRVLQSIGKKNILGYLKPINFGFGRVLRKGKFDAIIINGYNRPYHWLVILRCKLLGMQIFIRDEPTLFSKQRSKIKKLLKRIFFTILNRMVTGYLSIGTENERYYLSNGVSRDKMFLTPYAVDNNFFSIRAKMALKRQAEVRKNLNLQPDRQVVLYVGKLQYRKQALSLFDAFVQASKLLKPQPYLIFIGEGELSAPLKKRIKLLGNDSVRLFGFLNQSELPTFYSLCDVLVLPAFYETWGLVVNEAMCAGKAVILSDQVGAGYDLLKNGENGYMFPAGDVCALANSIVKVLYNPSRCRKMGERSAEIIAKWSFNEDVKGIRQALGLENSTIDDRHPEINEGKLF